MRVNNARLQHRVEEDALQQHMTRDKTDAQRVEPKRKRKRKDFGSWDVHFIFYKINGTGG